MKYSALFTIEIEHDYFSVTKPDLLRIVPTRGTESILSGAGLISKFYQNRLFVLVRHLELTTPVLALQNDFELQFFIEIVGFDFSLITNYHTDDPYNKKLYFSNGYSIVDGNDKAVDGTLYLNEKLPQFNAANEYHYNDLVRSGSNIAYECLQKLPANTGNLNNNSHFRKLPVISYVNPGTALLFSGQTKVMKVQTPAAEINLRYYQYNAASKQYDTEIKHTHIGPVENPTNEIIDEVLLNFHHESNSPFSEGIYRITINAQEEFLYFRPDNDWQPYLGLINIHNNLLAAGTDYRFLKEDGTFFMEPPGNVEIAVRNYKIHFAPSQYLLKYVCKSNKVTDITDDDGIIEFDNLGSNVFQSKLPVRMSETAIDTISVSYDGSDVLQKTKLPGYRRLSQLDDENKYMVSETFLNL